MFKGYRDGKLAIGLIAGIGLTTLFFAWLNGWIEPPSEPTSESYSPTDHSTNDYEGWPYWWHWAQRLVSYEDTVAQWIMMLFTIIAAVILYFTLKRVDETNRLALEANETLRRSFEIEARAYVDVQKCRFYQESPERGKLVFEIANKGNTPAMSMRFYCHGYWTKDPVHAAPKLEFSGDRSTAVIAKDGVFTVEKEISPPCGAETFSEVNQGFALAILVTYRDVFKKKRRTLYSGYLTKSHIKSGLERFQISPKHNRNT